MTPAERLATRRPWERRTVALVGLFGAVAVIWMGIIAPLHWLLISQGDWRRQVRHDLAHARGKADSEPTLRKQMGALASHPLWSRFFPSAPGQDISAQVQRDIVSIGSASGVTVQAATALPRVAELGLAGYGVRFTSTMSAEQLHRFMGALRNNPHYLRIERLNISAPQVQPADQNAVLTMTLEVFGYTRVSEASEHDTSDAPTRDSL